MIMGYMKASDEVYPKYVRHLALLVSTYYYKLSNFITINFYSVNMLPQVSEKKNLKHGL